MNGRALDDSEMEEVMSAVVAKMPPMMQPFGRETLAALRPQLAAISDDLFEGLDLDGDVSMDDVVDRLAAILENVDLTPLGVPVRAVMPIEPGEWLAPLRTVSADMAASELRAIGQRVFGDPILGLADVMGNHLPANWVLTDLLDTLRLVVGTPALPLVDVPDSETVAQLVAAYRAGRDVIGVLTDRSEQILESLAPLALGSDLACRYLKDTIAAMRAGLHRPALHSVLVACDVLTRSMTTSTARSSQLMSAYRLDAAHDVPLPELRRRLVLHCATRLYAQWYPASNDPMPADPSRNVVSHNMLEDDERVRRDALLGALLLGNLVIVHPDLDRQPVAPVRRR